MFEICLVPKTVTHHTLCTLCTTMVAGRGSRFMVFVKALACDRITWDAETSDTVDLTKSKIEAKEGTTPDEQRSTFCGKQLENERMISDCNIIHTSTLCASGRLKGGAAMSAEDITNVFSMVPAELQQVRTALSAEQVTTGDLRQIPNRR